MIKRFSSLLLLLLVAGAAAAQTEGLGARRHVLRNGLTVVLAPDSLAAAVDVAVWYRTGPVYESPGQSGISYLLGRLMYRGTKRHPDGEFRRLLQAQGAAMNSVTNPDFSCYYQTVPAEALDLTLELEADRMAGLAITPQTFEAERDAARADFTARLEASPLALGVARLYATAFGDHPYGRPVLGKREELDALSPKDVEAFARARHVPGQALLTIVGRFDAKAVMATVDRTFGAVPKRSSPKLPLAKLPAATGEMRGDEPLKMPGRAVLVGWRGPGAKDPDAAAVDVLAEILVRGAGSRVARLAASQSDILFQAQGDLDASEQASLLYVLGLAAGADSSLAEQVIVAEVEQLAREPVSAEELEQAKRQIEVRTLSSWQTVRGRAQSLGLAQLLEGDAKAATARLERVRKLVPEDVRLAASRMLTGQRRSVVWMSGGAGGQP